MMFELSTFQTWAMLGTLWGMCVLGYLTMRDR